MEYIVVLDLVVCNFRAVCGGVSSQLDVGGCDFGGKVLGVGWLGGRDGVGEIHVQRWFIKGEVACCVFGFYLEEVGQTVL